MQSSFKKARVVTSIYHSALAAKFDSIMMTIAVELGYSHPLSGLTAHTRGNIQTLAEQAILNWAVERRTLTPPPSAVTNLQHLLEEYCILADYI